MQTRGWVGCLRAAGFALTKMNLPFETTTDIADMAETMLERTRDPG